jgi:hypothetical protein
MSTRAFVIRRFGIGSLASWGFVIGALAACLPAFLCSAIFFTLTSTVQRIVTSWRDVGISFLGQRLSLNFVDLLRLQNFYDALNTITALGWFGILLLALGIAALLGIFVALAFALFALLYNVTGRIKIELTEI